MTCHRCGRKIYTENTLCRECDIHIEVRHGEHTQRLRARIAELEKQNAEYFRTEIIYEKALKEIADNYCPPWHRVDGHIIAKDALFEASQLAAESDVKEKFEYYRGKYETGAQTESVSGLD